MNDVIHGFGKRLYKSGRIYEGYFKDRNTQGEALSVKQGQKIYQKRQLGAKIEY